MKRNNTPWRPLEPAAVGWTERGEPRSADYRDVYYSSDNGLEESRHVFLQGNELPGRWQSWRARHFCIAETGFGTGLNFLATWQAWLASPTAPDLHYLSVEKHPLNPADLSRALAAWPALAPLTSQLLQQYPGLLPGQHRLLFEGGRITLDLWWEDACNALPDLASRARPMVDAWYLDGFAPARNEAMWQAPVLDSVARLSHPQATFSTFTAVGHVRRRLSRNGFSVVKVPGYARKRESLRGKLTGQPPVAGELPDTPWDLPGQVPGIPQRALVLGAGLAGCTVAAALARRGIEVILLEEYTLASAGSGNDQGILYTRLSRRHSALTDFGLQSFRFSAAFYRNLFAGKALLEGRDGALCGSFHQSANTEEMEILATVLQTAPDIAQVLDAHQASEILGIEQPAAGYWFPASGWLRPAAVCSALASQPRIRLHEGVGNVSLAATTSGWRATDSSGQSWEAPCAIIAAGTASARPAGLDWLPVQAIRGQTTQLPAGGQTSGLRAALCHEGYIAPARDGAHCIGATFNLADTDTSPRTADHRNNLANLAQAVPGWRTALDNLDVAALDGRVGFRCASPDYLPMVGAVPDRQAFISEFADLRRNARQALPRRGPCLRGLYLSTAHGSRGLTSAPMAAELLASEICAEPPPLSRELCRALAPARFIIRDLRRNRI